MSITIGVLAVEWGRDVMLEIFKCDPWPIHLHNPVFKWKLQICDPFVCTKTAEIQHKKAISNPAIYKNCKHLWPMNVPKLLKTLLYVSEQHILVRIGICTEYPPRDCSRLSAQKSMLSRVGGGGGGNHALFSCPHQKNFLPFPTAIRASYKCTLDQCLDKQKKKQQQQNKQTKHNLPPQKNNNNNTKHTKKKTWGPKIIVILSELLLWTHFFFFFFFFWGGGHWPLSHACNSLCDVSILCA